MFMNRRYLSVPAATILCLSIPVGLAVMAGDSVPGIISTVAGNGSQGSSGDGGPATSAQLDRIGDIAVDTAGNLYIAEPNAIRKVSPDGIISTVPGAPAGDIAVDAAGNIYVHDPGSIVKITPAGAVSTLADVGYVGWGFYAYFAGLFNDSAGNVYFAYSESFNPDSTIYKVNADGTAVLIGYAPAEINGLAVDSAGNLYASDCFNVWKVDPQGRTTRLFTSSSLVYCGAVDSRGNLFIAEEGENPRIWRVTPNGTTSIVAGDGTKGFSGDSGPATSAQLSSSVSIAIDNEDNLLIGDGDNYRVRKVVLATASEAFFAHVTVGGGYSTTVTLTNTGDTACFGILILTDSQGQPLDASGADVGAGSSFPVSIASAGTTSVSINPVSPGDPLRSGWATVAASGGVLSGVATWHVVTGGVVQAAAGVLASQPTRYATIPVDDDFSQGYLTAYAVANPTSQNLFIKLALVNEDGKVVDDSVTFTLAPKQHTARFLYQDVARSQFKGSIVLRAQEGGSFVAVALKYYHSLFTVIPVIPGKASSVPD